MIFASRAERVSDGDQPADPEPPPSRHEHHVGVRHVLENFQGVGADAGNQQRLIGRMNVARAGLGRSSFAALARLVEILAALFERGAVGAHGRVLFGIVARRHEHRARHAVDARGHGNRLAVIAGARGHDALRALLERHRADQVEAAAHLERARRVVVLVLHPDREAGRFVEERMAQQRRARQVRRDALPRNIHVVQGRGIHVVAFAYLSRRPRFRGDYCLGRPRRPFIAGGHGNVGNDRKLSRLLPNRTSGEWRRARSRPTPGAPGPPGAPAG